MRETANARSASGPWNKFRAGLDELHDLQSEYVTCAMALNRDLHPSHLKS
ncbi:hypothetical protein [Gluconobacter kanchanaburiensis]|nr:hypothetical protein [Gluconobacter kanchanaburiensis]MBF0861249.1 hypothetical protein [Gluconobacter kanchanaburiensis]